MPTFAVLSWNAMEAKYDLPVYKYDLRQVNIFRYREIDKSSPEVLRAPIPDEHGILESHLRVYNM